MGHAYICVCVYTSVGVLIAAVFACVLSNGSAIGIAVNQFERATLHLIHTLVLIDIRMHTHIDNIVWFCLWFLYRKPIENVYKDLVQIYVTGSRIYLRPYTL